MEEKRTEVYLRNYEDASAYKQKKMTTQAIEENAKAFIAWLHLQSEKIEGFREFDQFLALIKHRNQEYLMVFNITSMTTVRLDEVYMYNEQKAVYINDVPEQEYSKLYPVLLNNFFQWLSTNPDVDTLYQEYMRPDLLESAKEEWNTVPEEFKHWLLSPRCVFWEFFKYWTIYDCEYDPNAAAYLQECKNRVAEQRASMHTLEDYKDALGKATEAIRTNPTQEVCTAYSQAWKNMRAYLHSVATPMTQEDADYLEEMDRDENLSEKDAQDLANDESEILQEAAKAWPTIPFAIRKEEWDNDVFAFMEEWFVNNGISEELKCALA